MNDLARSIVDVEFPLVRRGYDPQVVASYLQKLAQEVAALESSDRVAEAEEVYRHRWREAGEQVTRILETADAEADRLRQGAEAMALEVRNSLKAEVARVRADAERHALEVRTGAEEFAAARLASVESECEQALGSAQAARAEAERMEHEAKVRADELTRRAEERVRSHLTDQLGLARQQLERLCSDEVGIAGRLIPATLEIAGEDAGPSVSEPQGPLLRRADPFGAPGGDPVDLDRDLRSPTNMRSA